jgi:lipopolysaccharide transport system permease protein
VHEPDFERTAFTIKPTHGWVALKLPEVFAFRELIWILAKREVSARYRQTAVGIAWAVIQPFMTMVICTLVFGRLAHLSSDGTNYSLFCFAGTLPWQFFSSAVSASSTSLSKNLDLLTKVYFPRLCMPIAAILPPMVDLAAGLVLMALMLLYFGQMPTWRILYLPLFVGLAAVCALGVGLWLSALTVEYRDLHHVLPFIIQLWMFASPVVYSSSMVPKDLRFIYGLNPIAGVISGFRWCLLSSAPPPPPVETLTSTVMALMVLVTGAFFFRRMERKFADHV